MTRYYNCDIIIKTEIRIEARNSKVPSINAVGNGKVAEKGDAAEENVSQAFSGEADNICFTVVGGAPRPPNGELSK